MTKVLRLVLSASTVALVAVSAHAGAPADLTRFVQPTVRVVRAQGSQPSVTAQAIAPVVVLDDFNRADGPLGANWILRTGSFGIVSDTARGSNALATFVGGTGAALEADVATNGTTDTEYVALVLDYADLSNNLFLKVQTQNGAGTFDTAACYVGNNGVTGGFGASFFSLSATFATAHMRVERNGTTVTMTFSNIDGGSGTQVYTCGGAPATAGFGIGIGALANAASLDNFAAAGPAEAIPAAGSVGLLLLALALLGSGLVWLIRRA